MKPDDEFVRHVMKVIAVVYVALTVLILWGWLGGVIP
jgi:hypothetical protein